MASFRDKMAPLVKECEIVAVSSIQLGQLWQFEETGENWLITRVYSEVFASYAVLRKVGGRGLRRPPRQGRIRLLTA